MENFNVFKNLGLHENQHSNLLKKLLATNGKHNQEDLFLKSFLEMIGVEYNNEQWKPETEKPAGKKGRVDLVVHTIDWKRIVIIENKINGAKNQENQLYRYWKNMGGNDKTKDIHLVFLAKNKKEIGGYEQYLENSITKPQNATYDKLEGLPGKLDINKIKIIDYKEDMVNWLKSCKIDKNKCSKETACRVECVLSQYIEFIEEHL